MFRPAVVAWWCLLLFISILRIVCVMSTRSCPALGVEALKSRQENPQRSTRNSFAQSGIRAGLMRVLASSLVKKQSISGMCHIQWSVQMAVATNNTTISKIMWDFLTYLERVSTEKNFLPSYSLFLLYPYIWTSKDRTSSSWAISMPNHLFFAVF
jgi:hypothetical protein